MLKEMKLSVQYTNTLFFVAIEPQCNPIIASRTERGTKKRTCKSTKDYSHLSLRRPRHEKKVTISR